MNDFLPNGTRDPLPLLIATVFSVVGFGVVSGVIMHALRTRHLPFRRFFQSVAILFGLCSVKLCGDMALVFFPSASTTAFSVFVRAMTFLSLVATCVIILTERDDLLSYQSNAQLENTVAGLQALVQMLQDQRDAIMAEQTRGWPAPPGTIAKLEVAVDGLKALVAQAQQYQSTHTAGR